MSLASGARLGPYLVLSPLGSGGMGEVYRARDTKLERDVAVKVLPAAFVADPERLARFEREAKLLAQLNHPNIAQIYGMESSGESHALVMELVDGPTLADRLERGTVPLDEALSLAKQIAEALEEAHEKGIVHRDLKPQNVKASLEGRVKVLDFGLAKAMDPAAGSGSVAASADLLHSPTLMNSPTLTAAHGTQLGVILGTAAYMAPEQARGAAVDKRADIWAFGVVLYEMLIGKRLFEGETVSDTLAAVLRQEIEWSTLPQETPPAIRQLLRRCLERNPRNRLHDIADARIVLDEVASGDSEEPASGRVVPSAQRVSLAQRALPWVLGTVLGLALGLLAGPRFSPTQTSKPSRLISIRTLVAAGLSSDPSVSPDGRTLAFGSLREGVERIWIKDLKSGSESPLVTRPSFVPIFSPDGTSVLYMANNGDQAPDLYRTTLATRESRLVARQAAFGSWFPDGKSVVLLRDFDPGATNGGGELVAVELESGRERVLYRDPARRLNSPLVSPNGSRVAVVLPALQSGTTDELGLVDLASGRLEARTLDVGGASVAKLRGLCWLGPKKLALLALDRDLRESPSGRILTLDLESGSVQSLLPVANVGWGLDRAGADSLIVGVGSTDQSLLEAKRDGAGRWGAPVPVTEGPFQDRQPAYSPDGKWLLFSSNRSSNLDIWRLERSTGELQRLTDHEAVDWDPAMSPDGTKLLFSSNRSGRFEIWIAEPDGSSPRQVTDFENAQNPTLTADGAWIVFVRQGGAEETNGIWRIHPDGSGAELVTAGAYLIPETSPDGRYVAFRGPGERRLVRVRDGTLLDARLAVTDRYRWTVERGRTFLWALGFENQASDIRRYPFDPERGIVGSVERLVGGAQVQGAESLGVAADGSAVAFASFANRRGQLLRIDGLSGLEP